MLKNYKRYCLTDTVKKIGSSAFSGSGLEYFYAPDKTGFLIETLTIEKNCFRGCKKLKIIKIPEGVQNLREATFQGCSNLKRIKLPESLTKVGDNKKYLFRDCSNLQTIEFGPNVDEISLDILNSGVETITIHSFAKLKIFMIMKNNDAEAVPSLKQFIYTPKNIVEVYFLQFTNCINLETVILKNVKIISGVAFKNTGVRDMCFDKVLTRIDDEAFCNCRNLKMLRFLNPEPPIVGLNAFDNFQKITVFIPKGSLKKYETALKDSGGDFKFIEE